MKWKGEPPRGKRLNDENGVLDSEGGRYNFEGVCSTGGGDGFSSDALHTAV